MRIGVWVMIMVGVLLLAVSAPMLYAHYREYALAEKARNQYAIQRIPIEPDGFTGEAYVFDFRGNRIELRDEFTKPTEERRHGPIRITVNGRDHSIAADAVIRPAYRDSNRYHGYLALAELTDRKTGTVRLAIVQRIDGHTDNSPSPMEELRWRVLLVSEDGTVEEETFAYGEHTHPLYRTRLANFATPMSFGYESNVLNVWLSLFYPILYPYVTALAGMTLLLSGAVGLFMLRRVNGKPAI